MKFKAEIYGDKIAFNGNLKNLMEKKEFQLLLTFTSDDDRDRTQIILNKKDYEHFKNKVLSIESLSNYDLPMNERNEVELTFGSNDNKILTIIMVSENQVDKIINQIEKVINDPIAIENGFRFV